MYFQKFDKIPRLSRDIVITEKIDGTNAQIYIMHNDYYISEMVISDHNATDEIKNFKKQYCLYEKDNILIFVGSRSRWLDTSSKGDNFGFAKWVVENAEELFKLGEGRHYGEWYGKGIQRGYGLDEKRFVLFNVGKWVNNFYDLKNDDKKKVCPSCCEVVPVLYRGEFDTAKIQIQLDLLENCGSRIAEGFKNPEGIIIYHTASGKLFKKTIHDDQGKNEKDKISS